MSGELDIAIVGLACRFPGARSAMALAIQATVLAEIERAPEAAESRPPS